MQLERHTHRSKAAPTAVAPSLVASSSRFCFVDVSCSRFCFSGVVCATDARTIGMGWLRGGGRPASTCRESSMPWIAEAADHLARAVVAWGTFARCAIVCPNAKVCTARDFSPCFALPGWFYLKHTTKYTIVLSKVHSTTVLGILRSKFIGKG
jgi:hypothetical protein